MLVLFNGKHNVVFGLIKEVTMRSKDQKGDKEMSNNVLNGLDDNA